MPPTTIRWWHTITATQESRTHVNHPLCATPGPDGRPCNTAPAWVAAWTVNRSGLPNLGKQHSVYLCGGCLHERLDPLRKDPYVVGAIALTPYKEITS